MTEEVMAALVRSLSIGECQRLHAMLGNRINGVDTEEEGIPPICIDG